VQRSERAQVGRGRQPGREEQPVCGGWGQGGAEPGVARPGELKSRVRQEQDCESPWSSQGDDEQWTVL
jgi:hypothetical protein